MRTNLEATGSAEGKGHKRRACMTKAFQAFAVVAAGTLIMVSGAFAQFDATAPPTNDAGYIQGDPSAGKLIPFYQFSSGRCDLNGNDTIDPIEESVTNDCGSDADCLGGENCVDATTDLATLIGFMNTRLNPGGRDDIFVHIEVFDISSNPIFSKTVCLSQGDFGYIVLQQPGAGPLQTADQVLRCGPDSPDPQPDPTCKATILSQEVTNLPSKGYVTLSARRPNSNPDNDQDFACEFGIDLSTSDTADQDQAPGLYAWAVLQDVSEGFFGTEIPVVSAGVNFVNGAPGGIGASTNAEPCGLAGGQKVPDEGSPDADAHSGVACIIDTTVNGSANLFGLISGDRRVGARYDCNPNNESSSTLVVWAQNNDSGTVPIIARGEDEGCFDGSISIDDEVNLINLCDLPPVRQLTTAGTEFRGAIEFITPGTSLVDGYFLFTLLTQSDQNFVLTQLPYQTGFDATNDAATVICPPHAP